jgi:DNA polymerase/3'-5' exonuclease PolX
MHVKACGVGQRRKAIEALVARGISAKLLAEFLTLSAGVSSVIAKAVGGVSPIVKLKAKVIIDVFLINSKSLS